MSVKNKIVSQSLLRETLRELKAKGKKVVFTNGCFDLVHLGHLDYLEKARGKGDALVIGLNSDQSIRRLKGASRPVMDENSRARLLAALEFVDYVVLFNEDTPLELIRDILPDILVKGDDYQVSNIVGADIVMSNGGKVETVELVKGYSSTAIIEKIKNLN